MNTAPVRNAFALPRFTAAAQRFVGNEDGATAIEYGLIVSLIFLAIIGAVNAYVNATSEMYSEITSTLGAG